MAETPEQIWINKVVGRHPGDWNFTDGQHLTRKQLREQVKYIREDVAEAEKQLAVAAALREMEAVVRKHIYHDSAGTGFAEDAFGEALLALIPDAGAALDRYVKERSDEALAAQRERCAKVAEAHVDAEYNYGPDFDAGWEAAAFAIAAAIRHGSAISAQKEK